MTVGPEQHSEVGWRLVYEHSAIGQAGSEYDPGPDGEVGVRMRIGVEIGTDPSPARRINPVEVVVESGLRATGGKQNVTAVVRFAAVADLGIAERGVGDGRQQTRLAAGQVEIEVEGVRRARAGVIVFQQHIRGERGRSAEAEGQHE